MMNLIQILFGLYFAFLGAYLSVLMARILNQNGMVLKKMDEGFRMMGSKMDEGFKRMDEGFRIMAELVVSEGEKTKELIKSLKEPVRG